MICEILADYSFISWIEILYKFNTDSEHIRSHMQNKKITTGHRYMNVLCFFLHLLNSSSKKSDKDSVVCGACCIWFRSGEANNRVSQNLPLILFKIFFTVSVYFQFTSGEFCEMWSCVRYDLFKINVFALNIKCRIVINRILWMVIWIRIYCRRELKLFNQPLR